MKNSVIIIIILVVLVGAGAFFAGIQYQKAQRPRFGQFNTQGRQQQEQGKRQRQNNNFRPVRGEIINSDEQSVTVKMQDGSSKIVLISDKTTIVETTSAAKQSLEKGKQVMVMGTENSDGSITAQNIQLNPQGRMMQGQEPRQEQLQ